MYCIYTLCVAGPLCTVQNSVTFAESSCQNENSPEVRAEEAGQYSISRSQQHALGLHCGKELKMHLVCSGRECNLYTFEKRVFLLSRTCIPNQDQWNGILKSYEMAPCTARRLRVIQEK